jgi:hypothetical protein
MQLKNPNGVLVNSKVSSIKWNVDAAVGTAYYVIDNPTPGDWKVAATTAGRARDRMYYTTRVFQNTKVKDSKTNVLKSIFGSK